MTVTRKTYASPAAQKAALEDRLKARAARQNPPVPVDRVRQRLVMERFLARVVDVAGDAVTLKGGLALEFRVAAARSTKDIDLRMTGNADAALALLQKAAQLDLGDLLTFDVKPNAEHPDIEDALYEGRRFDVVAGLASKVYGRRFTVDVSMGDPMHGPAEPFVGSDLLDFVGVPPVRVGLYPLETHLAEKLHAYTRPPKHPLRVNSRVKDLPDIAIIAGLREFDAATVRAALEMTFGARDTHPLPPLVAQPPASWAETYRDMRDEHNLPWVSVDDLYAAVVAFLGPVLDGTEGKWNPQKWAWE